MRSFINGRAVLNNICLFVFKTLSAAVLGIFLAVLGQALIQYRYFSFIFILLTGFFSYFVLTKNLRWLGVCVVDILFVLFVLLVRWYVVLSSAGGGV